MRKIIYQGMVLVVAALLLTACGGGGTPTEPTAIEQIASYAKDGGTAPTVQTYADAGITGVTEENLDEINALVAELEYEDVDTAEEVQALVERLGVDIIAPIFTSPASVNVAENQTAALTLVATDSSAVRYTISGTDAGSFTVDAGTGVVTFNTAPDYETKHSYTFTATATDAEGNSATQEVTITIIDIDEVAPTITLNGDDPLTIAQGATFSDPGATATDNVDGSVAVSVSGSVDTAAIGSYTLTYTALDSAGNEASATRTVEVKDLTPPTFTSQASVSVQENQTDALTLQAIDANPPISYAMSGGDSSAFDVNATTGVVTFKSAPDFETQDLYTFSATAIDKYGNEATQEVNVTIIDVAEVQLLKKTGQTKSYDKDGNEVTDGSIKDDGFYQKGVDPSYTRDDTTEIVTDHITGLQWQDDANASSVKKQWLTDANYNTCDNNHSDPACYDTSGDTAATYCSNLTLGGYTDWRLPTLKELMYIADRGKRNPAIDTTAFTHVVSDRYWSSTTVVGSEDDAWGVDFYYGGDGGSYKSGSDYVCCVRDGQP